MSTADVKKHGTAEEAKTVTIIVNGRAKTVPKNEEITFDQVVALAFPNPPAGDGVQFTIQYTRGQGHKPTGTLVEGQSVKVKDGMEFDVTPTNRS
jgi:Multiubiquitin